MRGRPSWRRATALATVAIWITATACASPAVSVAPSSSTTPAVADACQPIDVRTSSGERVDLSGTWQQIGDGPLFYVSQDADCVWIVGRFVSDERGEPISLYQGQTFAFDGHLRPDFTLRGRWMNFSLVEEDGVSGSGPWTVDVDADPWTLRGPLVGDDFFGRGRLTLEKVADGWVAP